MRRRALLSRNRQTGTSHPGLCLHERAPLLLLLLRGGCCLLLRHHHALLPPGHRVAPLRHHHPLLLLLRVPAAVALLLGRHLLLTHHRILLLLLHHRVLLGGHLHVGSRAPSHLHPAKHARVPLLGCRHALLMLLLHHWLRGAPEGRRRRGVKHLHDVVVGELWGCLGSSGGRSHSLGGGVHGREPSKEVFAPLRGRSSKSVPGDRKGVALLAVAAWGCRGLRGCCCRCWGCCSSGPRCHCGKGIGCCGRSSRGALEGCPAVDG